MKYSFVILLFLLTRPSSIECNDEKKDEIPLISAVQENNIEKVKTLIQNKVDVDQTDLGGRTALMYAASSKNVAIISLLKQAKADTNLEDNDGFIVVENQGNYYIEHAYWPN